MFINKALNFSFWNKQDLVINGLDNIEGRIYLDTKCNEFEIPFLESGTEGQMAHSSLIIPNLTNCYVDDPANPHLEGKIKTTPFCTLRNEPYLISHCTEWALSKFNDHFNVGIRDLKIFLETNISNQIDLSYGEVESLMKILEWINKNKCVITFEECLRYSLSEYDQYFNKDVQIILESNQRANERNEANEIGVSKVEPIPQKFNIETDDINSEKSHFEYVYCYACLLYISLNGDNLRKELFPEKMVEQNLKECNQPKITSEQTRQKAKEILIKIIDNPSQLEEDKDNNEVNKEDEEEIITTSPQIEDNDVQMQINFCNKLTFLRESVKISPYIILKIL